MKIYSYKDEGCEELLVDHVSRMLAFSRSARLVRMGEELARRKGLSLGFGDALALSAVLHDIGKIPYSEMYGRRPRISFAGHEHVSYYLTMKLFPFEKTPELCAVALAVLSHHHSMKMESRLGGAVSVSLRGVLEYLEEARALSGIVILDEAVEKARGLLEREQLEVSKASLGLFPVDRTKREVLGSDRLAGYFGLLLTGLIALDYHSAIEGRRGCGPGQGEFGGVMEEFYRIYLT